jgi:predicted transposase/invertase (TIGR01784 family)
MSYTKKTFEELDVMDDFLMNAVAADPEVGEDFCRTVLSVLLNRSIGKLRIVAQRTIPALTPEHRGIRMDVEIVEPFETEETDDTEMGFPLMNIYDLEPHKQKGTSLPRHNRFYQAKIDSRYLKSGETDFSTLPNLYVITLLNYDPFGYGHMLYTIHNKCEEVDGLRYEDGLEFLYFNTTGSKGGSAELRNMLRYFQDSRAENATDAATRKLHEYLSKVKMQPETRLEYMKYDEIIAWERREAAEEAAEKATCATKRNDIMELLEDYGEIPDYLREQIEQEESIDTLKKWFRLAVKASSIEEFASQGIGRMGGGQDGFD